MTTRTATMEEEEDKEPIQLANFKCKECNCTIFKICGFVDAKDWKGKDTRSDKIQHWAECVNCESSEPIEGMRKLFS